jgi:predicted nucleic acid-binding protein
MTVVLDASVLIAHLDGNDVHHGRAVDLLLAATGSPFAASVVTIAEVLVGPARVGALGRAQGALDALGLAPVGLGVDSPAQLATLRAESGLKLPDCCVLLAARDTGASAVLTFDHRLADAARAVGLPTGEPS